MGPISQAMLERLDDQVALDIGHGVDTVPPSCGASALADGRPPAAGAGVLEWVEPVNMIASISITPLDNKTARWTAFSSSRTLPRQ